MNKVGILLIVPRFHTNLEPIASAFVSRGYEVQVFPWRKAKAELRYQNKKLIFADSEIKRCYRFRNIEINCFRFLNMIKILRVREKQFLKMHIFIRSEISIFGIVSLLLILLSGSKNRSVVYTQYPKTSKKLRHRLWKYLVINVIKLKYFTQVYSKPDISKTKFRSVSDYDAVLFGKLKEESGFIPFALPRINFSKQKKENHIISVGKAEDRKGFIELIETFRSLHQVELKTYKLVLVMQVAKKEHKEIYGKIREENRDLIQSERLYLFCNLQTIETRRKIAKSNVFVLNSHDEPASFAQFEAIALNTPVILNRDNGACEILPDNFGIMKIRSNKDLERAIVQMVRYISQNRKSLESLNRILSNRLDSDYICESWLSL
jgi:glycosyltransferase involved in cell wall biosynthesis